ncbi:hypothetical protein [Actinomadura algeriensis]|uniref:Mce-associated membrane protein n=1 Tax=Actinomadura algeriensis TaxID=1679523 RepID=A0ABR9JRL1_9ACTN|nr:hypothetical protein [Actinomadura algeriensis]MBE1533128.1 Mce-associated membrane protein [Actinomadura algeriensis]
MPADVETAEDLEPDAEAAADTQAEDTAAEETGAESAKAEPADVEAAKPKVAKPAKPATVKAAKADGEPSGGEDGTKRGRRGPTRGTLVRAAAVLVLLAAVVTAGLQWYRADQSAQEEAARDAVREQAGEFGQALLSYDHEHLQDARNRVLSLASEDFAKTYDVAFTGGLEGVITKLKADASATVRAVYLGDVDETTARAIVVMDSEVRSSAGTRRVLGSHLDMRLMLKDGRWRVTEVTSIGAAQETMTDPDGQQQGGGESVVPTPGASPSE